MAFHRCNRFMAGLLLLSLPAALAADTDRLKQSYSEPELHTLAPLGGRVGSSLAVEVRGKFLDGAYAAWLSHDAFEVRVKSVEAVAPPKAAGDAKDQPKDDGEYRVTLQIDIAPDAAPGPHPLRLVAPGGVSNRLYLQIHEDPVIAESSQPHQQPATAQPVAVPVVVNGTIGRHGELDYYSLEASGGQEVAFEVIFTHETLAKGFRPQLRIYETAGSWLGSRQLTQLAFHSEIVGEINLSPGEQGPPPGTTPINSGLKYRFGKAGRYLVEVAGERFQGKPEYAYQLRMVPAGVDYQGRLKDSEWGRTFTRRISADRLETLWARTVTSNRPTDPAAEGQSASGRPNPETAYDNQQGKRPAPIPNRVTHWTEAEPNDAPGRATDVALPALIQGTIDRPGDVDTFRFKLASAQRLAFEIETPGLSPPHFTPRVEIKDGAGRSMLTNLHRVKSTLSEGQWVVKDVEPKMIETFDLEGEYTIEVRDVTSRSGSRGCQYRLLVRPQIPHLGEFTVETLKRGTEDRRIDPLRINLTPGEAKALTITARIEEIDARITDSLGERAFDWGTGEMIIMAEGLPRGVKALPGTGILKIKGKPRYETLKKYNYLPDVLQAVLVFHAEDGAPAMTLPESVRITAQPLIGGRPGPSIPVAELPLIVVGGAVATAVPGESVGK
jgi:hypothetical protein